MNKQIKDLKECAFILISEEQLPKPYDFKFRFSTRGNMRRQGCCHCRKDRLTDERKYRIIVNLVEPNMIPISDIDEHEAYYVINDKPYIMGVVGKKKSMYDITMTTAHEIAHLKIWKHPPEHKIYTLELFEKLKFKMLKRGYDVVRGFEVEKDV